MKTGYEQHVTEAARLTILRALHEENDLRMNHSVLVTVLDTFGFRKSQEWVRTQLRRLEDLGAVTINEVGTVLVATLTTAGAEHVERRVFIEGIKRPSPEA